MIKQMTAAIAAILGLTMAIQAQSAPGADPKEVREMLDRSIAYLKSAQQKDGSFAPKLAGPGVTAIVVAGLARNGVPANDPTLAKALSYLESQVQKDGGIYNKFLANYTTSIAIMAYKEVNTDGKYTKVIQDASNFLKNLQKDVDEKNPVFGGFGYDGKSRPDTSNTAFSVEALIAAGVPANDPSIQRALKFISRCQNLPGETNDLPFAQKTTKEDQGGFVYNPLDEKEDSAHRTAAGGLRSVGGMTYNGLKSFLYAGVDKKDKRVQAALKWVRDHYTLEENPGMGKAGLYYYYHTFAKAMHAFGDDSFEDAAGTKHDWRRDLFAALKKRQQDNGSWVNEGERTFGEASPELATGFALLSLSYTKK